jgi:hypothetical protein
MTIEAQKLEVINKITLLKDALLLAMVNQILDKANDNVSNSKPRQAGWENGIFTYVADDFDEISEGFGDYFPQK